MLALVPVKTLAQLQAEEKAAAEAKQAEPLVQSLAAHVDKRFNAAKEAKRDLETRMLENLRRRDMEYDPEKLADIRKFGGSEIYMGITSTKCRAATSWLRDALLGSGADKPWRLGSTPEPELPPDALENLQKQIVDELYSMAMHGMPLPDQETLRQMAHERKDELARALHEEAQTRLERMETKMEDQLAEGGFLRAMHEFLDDLVTFPFAVMKGPVHRKRKVLKWSGSGLVAVEETVPEWERVDPFMFYWAPWARSVSDGYCVEHHKLTRMDIQALLGVEGYNESALRLALSEFGGGGLSTGDGVLTEKANAEGRNLSSDDGSDDLMDAYQLWDTVPGELLIEWGMTEEEIPDSLLAYPCEVWKVGSYVVKAVLNYDPLGRKPYYVSSYEKIPGKIDGNAVPDLCRDSQDMCNSAARALANNMGIASGPQVGLNISRIPAGEKITNMFPWKLWQFQASDYNDGAPPISFFQPNSNAQELMAVFERFSSRADEDTGLPKYMTGEHVPGVGRTSSGLSMLISNAGKTIKQVIGNIDSDVITQAIERLYQRNLRYSQDPDLIGDVKVVAQGAMSLVVKEAEAVRQREFLQLVLQSPVAQQIVGLGGTSELLRESARTLHGNVDRIVPPRKQIEQMMAQQAAMQQAMMQQAMNPEFEDVQFKRDESGAVVGATKRKPKQLLEDGTPQGGRQSNFISSRPNNK